jgi:excinuclease ABC subunit C
LLREFKSVKRIKEASLEELTALIGKAKAELVMNGLKGEG